MGQTFSVEEVSKTSLLSFETLRSSFPPSSDYYVTRPENVEGFLCVLRDMVLGARAMTDLCSSLQRFGRLNGYNMHTISISSPNTAENVPIDGSFMILHLRSRVPYMWDDTSATRFVGKKGENEFWDVRSMFAKNKMLCVLLQARLVQNAQTEEKVLWNV